jgi:hypothetical protein
MNRLLIFTNSTSIVNVDSNINEKIKNLSLLDEANNSGFFRLKNNALVETHNLSESDLFFTSDSLTQTEYNNIFDTKGENDEVYILYHRKHDKFILRLNNNSDKCKIGQHIQPESGLYAIALKILLDNEDDKCKRIIDRIFKGNPILEAKLELLHNCLVPESIPFSLNSPLSSYNGAFRTFNTERNNKSAFDEDYIKALTKLRNALLDS